jgi:hypothetical protein
MPFELSAVSKEELREVVNMSLKASDHTSSFVNAVYPHRFTDCGIEGLDMVVGRLAYLWDVDPIQVVESYRHYHWQYGICFAMECL